ncbi:MAG: hypothetical protein AAFW84_22535 [Cyanobacteria bacterium J06635_15]
MNPLDLDQTLQLLCTGYTQATRIKRTLGWPQEQWRPGKPLKLLLAGYNGARNTGADVRVSEIVRQLQHLLGQSTDLTVTTLDPTLTADYFQGAKQVRLPHIFPQFLARECPQHHGVIACEGSMFKSKFADSLSTMMSAALGLAAIEEKLSVGYGAEAGAMNASLQHFVRRQCQNSLILCRNQPSQTLLSQQLRIRSTAGADTAWTFEPDLPQRGVDLLKQAGWDGTRPVLTLCPINPFWWPIKPSLRKFIHQGLTGKYREQHYKSLYFHHHSATADRQYRTYIQGLAQAVNAFSQQRDIFTVVVGMERLDRRACYDLNAQLSSPAPCFISDQYTLHELVGILRQSVFLVSSRFHAIVTSMPGLVPSVGVTMDERIRNLMGDRHHLDLLLEVDDPGLGEKLLPMLHRLDQDREAIAQRIAQTVVRQLRLMGQMGRDFMGEVARVYPDFPQIERSPAWYAYLPPLSATTTQLLMQYA